MIAAADLSRPKFQAAIGDLSKRPSINGHPPKKLPLTANKTRGQNVW